MSPAAKKLLEQALELPEDVRRRLAEALLNPLAPETSYPRIARDSRIRGGQPVVAGTRIPVATIVRSQQLGMDFDELLAQYPSLVAADLHAAMLYYFDHLVEIDALLREADTPPEGASIIR